MSVNKENQELLTKSECVPCKGGVEPLKGNDLKELLTRLEPGWELINEHHIEKEYKFKNFRQGLEFVNKAGNLAESQGHHPEIYLTWGRVKIMLWTHKIGGLHKNDFIMAAKLDRIT